MLLLFSNVGSTGIAVSDQFLLLVFCKDTAELFFEDVRLPKESLLGEENKGFYYLMQELPQERLLIAAMGQAANEWMFEETRGYVKQRKAFGKTISNLQVRVSIFKSFSLFVFSLGFFFQKEDKLMI